MKTIERIKYLYVIAAAYNYHLAKSYAICANMDITFDDAEKLSELASFITKEKVDPTELIRTHDDDSNNAIKHWEIYNSYLNKIILLSFNENENSIKRFVNSFSNWCHNESILLKMYGIYFDFASEICVKISNGTVSNEIGMNYFENVLKKSPFLKISKLRFLRFFIELNKQQNIIMKKVKLRNNIKSND